MPRSIPFRAPGLAAGAIVLAVSLAAAWSTVAPAPAHAAGYVHLQTWGGLGTSDGRANWPLYLWADSKGTVWVADYRNDRVQRFTADGAFMSAFGSSGVGDGQFTRPTGVCYDEARQVIYVADSGNARVQKFTRYGTYLLKWGTAGSGAGQFSNPHGIAVDADGLVYVADLGNDRVQVFRPDGTFVRQFGGAGTGEGQMSGPAGIVVAADGTCFVSEAHNHRVQAFDASGAYLRRFGSLGSGEGQFISPHQLSFDKYGNILVCDWGNGRISRWTQAGQFLDSLGEQGTLLDGQLMHPEGVAGDAEGHIYVADLSTSRIQKFAWDDTAPRIFDDYAGDWFSGGATINFWGTDDYSRMLVFDIFGTTLTMPVGAVLDGIVHMGPGPFVGTMADVVAATDQVGNRRTRTVYYRVDTMAPVTRVSGVPAGWTNQDVTLDFIATDKGAGVEGTTCDTGGGWATVGADDVVTVSAEGATTVQYYSWDAAVPSPNQEATKTVTVRIDRTSPDAVPVNNVTVRRGATATFRYTLSDALSPTCRVKLVIKKKAKVVRTVNLGVKDSTPLVPPRQFAKRLAVTLPAGTYTWTVVATDLAGNLGSYAPKKLKVTL